MRKLNKDTRHLIRIGTVLKDGKFKAEVTNMQPSGLNQKGLNVTLKILDGRFAGRMIYMMPLSDYYGCTIEEEA